MRNIFSVPDEGIFQGKSNDNFELLKAWAGTTLAYAILQTGAQNILTFGFVLSLLVSAVVCGLAFVFHELAHRIVARRFGAVRPPPRSTVTSALGSSAPAERMPRGR